MFRFAGRVLMVIALCGALDLQWLTLQSVAWATMLVQNAQHASLSEAVAKTFDGAHPCALCHVVQKGKAHEKKSDLPTSAAAPDLICTTRRVALVPPFVLIHFIVRAPDIFACAKRPPTPPPRFCLG